MGSLVIHELPTLEAAVSAYEEEARKLPQTDVSVTHVVNGGIYTRTGLIPAGQRFTGAVHKKDHINIVAGDVTILTDNGPMRLAGYNIIKGLAGSKRVAVTHADTVWTTILRTDLTDIAEIENECVENPETLLTRHKELTCS